MLKRTQTPSPDHITITTTNEANPTMRKFCPGCTESISLEEDLCIDCSAVAAKQNSAKRRERTGRHCKSCKRPLGPERYFNCRSCVKPDDKMAQVAEYYEISVGGAGRKTVKLS